MGVLDENHTDLPVLDDEPESLFTTEVKTTADYKRNPSYAEA